MNNLLPPGGNEYTLLLAVIADPVKAKERLDQLTELAATAARSNDEARALQRSNAGERVDLAKRTEAVQLREQANAAMNIETREVDVIRREKAVDAREKAVIARKSEADKFHADAVQLRDDYEARLAKLRGLVQ